MIDINEIKITKLQSEVMPELDSDDWKQWEMAFDWYNELQRQYNIQNPDDKTYPSGKFPFGMRCRPCYDMVYSKWKEVLNA